MATGSERAGEAAARARLAEDFSALYRAHLRDVYSYAYYRVGNHHDAEDLTEQTFLQAYRRFALGMDNREIARALGRTDGATKVLLHRAIRQLEELVRKAESGEE